jgi:osmotically-inducible protein OsmY
MLKRSALILIVTAMIVSIMSLAWSVISRTPEEFDAARLAAELETTGSVRAAFALSSRLTKYELGVGVSNGVVTLTGNVPVEFDRDLAESIARDTPGVLTVDNQLHVDPGIRPSDERRRERARVLDLDIRADVRERMAISLALRDKRIIVGVKDRVVKLSGTVATVEQRAIAESLARGVPEVADVASEIVVAGFEEAPAPPPSRQGER